MISLPHPVGVFLHAPATDLRKGFDALCGLVTATFGQDPTSGHLFLFVNRRRDRIKILYWDRDGLVIWYKTQATDYPRTHWWNTPTVVGHNRPGGAAPTRGVVPTTTGDCAPRRITMLGRPRPTAPPRPERLADDR
jgi:IS66 Orf2 like protein